MLWRYRAKWRFVGMELEINPDDLDAIEVDKRTVADSLLEVIKLWLHRTNPKPTRTALTAVTESELLVAEAEAQSGTKVVLASYMHYYNYYYRIAGNFQG